MDLIKGILENYEVYLTGLFQLIGAVVVLISVVLRVKPSTTLDTWYGRLNKLLDGAAQYFPTIGINPRTKALQEWAEENQDNFPELKKFL